MDADAIVCDLAVHSCGPWFHTAARGSPARHVLEEVLQACAPEAQHGATRKRRAAPATRLGEGGEAGDLRGAEHGHHPSLDDEERVPIAVGLERVDTFR